jgi:hypothetical protein
MFRKRGGGCQLASNERVDNTQQPSAGAQFARPAMVAASEFLVFAGTLLLL